MCFVFTNENVEGCAWELSESFFLTRQLLQFTPTRKEFIHNIVTLCK